MLTDAPVHEVTRRGDELVVVHETGEVAADLVVHGAGRVADLAGLGLDAAGIEAGPRGVRVDEHLRSVDDAHVWAAGDAADKGLPLTPVASKEGKVVAAGILGEDAVYDGRAVPSVCFSDPPLAAVGMSTAEAADRGDAVHVERADASEWFSQRRVGQTHAGMAVVTDAASGRLLGAHLLGVNADEVVNVLALAIRHGLTAADLTAMTWSYPTATSDLPYVLGLTRTEWPPGAPWPTRRSPCAQPKRLASAQALVLAPERRRRLEPAGHGGLAEGSVHQPVRPAHPPAGAVLARGDLHAEPVERRAHVGPRARGHADAAVGARVVPDREARLRIDAPPAHAASLRAAPPRAAVDADPSAGGAD